MKNGIRIVPDDRILQSLPETAELLHTGIIIIHPAVKKVLVHGSRGPAGGSHEGSDLDISLVAETGGLQSTALEALLRDIVTTTLEQSYCEVELDVAALFDARHCDLTCLEATDYTNLSCTQEETGCLGVYKTQKGFHGFVPPILRVEKIFPFCILWERK